MSPLILDLSLHRTAELEMIRNLAKRGCNILLLGMRSKHAFRYKNYPDDCLDKPPKLLLVPIRYLNVIAPALYAFVTIFLIPMTILCFNPDFVIVESGTLTTSSILGIVVSKLRKTKLVLDIRSVPVEVGGFYGALHEFWFDVSVHIARKLFSGITIVTPMMKQEICAEFSINPSRVGVWENGATTTLFDPDAWRIQGNKLKAKLGLSGKFVVFYHGYVVSTRGLLEVIEAIKMIKKEHSNVVFFMLGSGPFADQLKSSIKRENIQNNVIIHDAVDFEQVPQFISMSDVAISPTPDYHYWRAQSPISVFEYLSMEKTVIATDLPLHRRIMGNLECAIYISSSNPEAIAKGIEFALANKDKLEDWGKLGRKKILSEYTWQKEAENLENYLLSLWQPTCPLQE